MRILAVILSSLVFVAASSAAPIADTYVLPVAGHVPGANGETWVTDVVLHNVTASTLVVELAGIGFDGQLIALTADLVTIGAHGTVALQDIVRPTGIGALVVAGSGPFAVTGQVSSKGARGSVGTSVLAVNEFLDSEGADAFLPGLVADGGHRTNLGFFAVAGATDLRFEITLLDSTGTTLGARVFEVPAGEVSHIQISSRDVAAVSFDVATARVRLTAGDGALAAYATVVDNVSSDSVFIPAALLSPSSSNLLRRRFGQRR